MNAAVQFALGWLLLIVGALIAWHGVVRPSDPVDQQFETAPREPDEVVDIDRIRRIFADMTTELPELHRCRDLSAYYLPGKEDHG